MKFFWKFLQSIFIIAVLCLLISTVHIPGQSVEPDEQIKREMIAYVKKSEEAMGLSRPRLANNLSEKKQPAAQLVPVGFGNNYSTPVIYASLEHEAFARLNEQRNSKGLPSLKWSEELAKIARYHSQNMAQYRFFSHTGLDGSLVNARADAFGFSDWKLIGENIAFNRGFKQPVESACQQWINSPAHRSNIFDNKWQETGIGIATADDGTYYFTQVFTLK